MYKLHNALGGSTLKQGSTNEDVVNDLTLEHFDLPSRRLDEVEMAMLHATDKAELSRRSGIFQADPRMIDKNFLPKSPGEEVDDDAVKVGAYDTDEFYPDMTHETKIKTKEAMYQSHVQQQQDEAIIAMIQQTYDKEGSFHDVCKPIASRLTQIEDLKEAVQNRKLEETKKFEMDEAAVRYAAL